MADVIQTTDLMTAEQFLVAEDVPEYCELVRGKVVEMNVPSPRHGEICLRIAGLLFQHCQTHDCGRAVSNDSGILVSRGPDSVRGADVAYYSFDRIPKGPMPDDYSGPAPEVVVEVLSKTDRWPATLGKTAEYLGADVQVVCIVDPAQRTVRLFRQDGTDITVPEDETFQIPEIKPTFSCKVGDVFE